jgi:hypothetical protein
MLQRRVLWSLVSFCNISHSYMYSFSTAGQLSFILICGSDTLPTPMNLHWWKIQLHSRCPLSSSPQATVNHILNACSSALEDGRYTWRHDSTLLRLTTFLKGQITSPSQIFADLNGHWAIESPPSTVLLSVVSTTARPDITIIQVTWSNFWN